MNKIIKTTKIGKVLVLSRLRIKCPGKTNENKKNLKVTDTKDRKAKALENRYRYLGMVVINNRKCNAKGAKKRKIIRMNGQK
jgi:hypothetical protein